MRYRHQRFSNSRIGHLQILSTTRFKKWLSNEVKDMQSTFPTSLDIDLAMAASGIACLAEEAGAGGRKRQRGRMPAWCGHERGPTTC
jgi:hypothetical protein